jgi:ketosteroid isomerase-like protein
VRETTNADLTRRGFELWNERRFDDLLELFHEEIVWDMRPFAIPDMALFRGHEGMRRFWAEWLQAFPDSTIEVGENHPDLDRARTAMKSYASADEPVPVFSDET